MKAKSKEPELLPDACQRLERAVDMVSKSPPQRRAKPTIKKKKRAKSIAAKVLRSR